MHSSLVGYFAALFIPIASAFPRTAQAATDTPAASALWPTPVAEDRGPSPELDVPELARRPAEMFASAGPLLFDCLPLIALCEPHEAGPRVSVGALWRAAPAFAWGGTLSLAKVGDGGMGTTLMAVLTARTYFAESGSLDPYLELSIGGGRYAHGARSGDRIEGEGMTMEAGGGVDFYLSDHVRFGPALHYGQFVFGPARVCSLGSCREQSLASVSPSRGFATLIVGVTVLAGDTL